jgi:DNA-binding MarR family transcriptional regulator
VIKRLEELNYLQRQPDLADERISRVFLKEEGWAEIHQIKDAFQQIDQVLLSNLSHEEQKTLHKLLMQVYSNLLTQPVDPS